MKNTDTAVPEPVIFVLGMSHSGSTLLGRMLDMHDSILCVGELMRIKEAIQKEMPCSCGAKIPECEFWSSRLPLIEKANNFQYKRFTPDLYEALGKASEKDIVVDLSKNKVLRVMNSFFSSSEWKMYKAGFILLLRDPRGVAASAVRSGRDLEKFLQRYIKWMERFKKFVRKRKDWVSVLRYEDLCMYPEHEIKRICSFMGLDFQSNMLLPAEKTHHFIHSSTSGYMKNSNKLKVDERWRHELSAENIKRIKDIIEKNELLKNAYQQV